MYHYQLRGGPLDGMLVDCHTHHYIRAIYRDSGVTFAHYVRGKFTGETKT